MRLYGHILRMNEERIPKKGLNMKVNGTCQHQDGNHRLGKMPHRGKEGHKKKLRRSCGKTAIDGEVWLSDGST
jgi:hypothetical protein